MEHTQLKTAPLVNAFYKTATEVLLTDQDKFTFNFVQTLSLQMRHSQKLFHINIDSFWKKMHQYGKEKFLNQVSHWKWRGDTHAS